MIKLAIEGSELLLIQTDDLLWVTSGLKGVWGIGKEGAYATLADD